MWINHVAIYGNNIDEMLFFYHTILGFAEINRIFDSEKRIHMIRLQVSDTQNLEIFNFNSIQIEKKSEYVNRGFMHICFGCKDVETIRTKIMSNNIICEDVSVGFNGRKKFFVEDPEKNLVEIMEFK